MKMVSEDESSTPGAEGAQVSENKACAGFDKQLRLAKKFMEELAIGVEEAVKAREEVGFLTVSKKIHRMGYRIDKLETALEELETDHTKKGSTCLV